jgi:hypothetical protein
MNGMDRGDHEGMSLATVGHGEERSGQFCRGESVTGISLRRPRAGMGSIPVSRGCDAPPPGCADLSWGALWGGQISKKARTTIWRTG